MIAVVTAISLKSTLVVHQSVGHRDAAGETVGVPHDSTLGVITSEEDLKELHVVNRRNGSGLIHRGGELSRVVP